MDYSHCCVSVFIIIMVIVIKSDSKTELSPDNFKVEIDKELSYNISERTVDCVVKALRQAFLQFV